MRSGHGLEVVLRVPVAVKDDNSVGSGEVDAQATGSGGQQEGKVSGAGRIEVLHCLQGTRALELEACEKEGEGEGESLVKGKGIS